MLFDVQAALAEIRAEEAARALVGSDIGNVTILDAVRAGRGRQATRQTVKEAEGKCDGL